MNDFDFIIRRPLRRSKYVERVQRKRDLVFLSDSRIFNIMKNRDIIKKSNGAWV